jgi:hypothetical protein
MQENAMKEKITLTPKAHRVLAAEFKAFQKENDLLKALLRQISDITEKAATR